MAPLGVLRPPDAQPSKPSASVAGGVVEDDLLEATEGTVRDALNTEFDVHQMTLLFDGNKVDLDQPVAELELTAENVENLQVVRAQQGDDDSSDDDNKVGDFRLSFDSNDVNIDDV